MIPDEDHGGDCFLVDGVNWSKLWAQFVSSTWCLIQSWMYCGCREVLRNQMTEWEQQRRLISIWLNISNTPPDFDIFLTKIGYQGSYSLMERKLFLDECLDVLNKQLVMKFVRGYKLVDYQTILLVVVISNINIDKWTTLFTLLIQVNLLIIICQARTSFDWAVLIFWQIVP